MKKILIFTIAVLSYCGAMAQKANIKIDTIYYDKNWKAAQSPLFADYYRLTMCDANCPQAGYKTRDYYITGELQGEGTCLQLDAEDDEKTVWQGKVVTYFKSGKLSSERTYENGKLNGYATSYFENGLVETKIPFSNDQINGLALFFTDDGATCKRVEYVNDSLKYDYYEVIDYKGNYSKYYHKDDKVKWESPATSEKQKAYSNGKVISYYENNGLTLAISPSTSLEYGKYIKFSVSATHNSCESVDLKIANIDATFKYQEGAEAKKPGVKVHILSALEYELKIARRQNAQKALANLANGMAAAQAGYSAATTQVNSGYAGASTNGSAYVGASSSTVNTVSYDGYAAYQANMMANAQRQAMNKEMLAERVELVNAYLKEDTIFPGGCIDGYFLIPIKIKGASKYGGDLRINFTINGANYLFEYNLLGAKERKAEIKALQKKYFRREISQAEFMQEFIKVCSYQAK